MENDHGSTSVVRVVPGGDGILETNRSVVPSVGVCRWNRVDTKKRAKNRDQLWFSQLSSSTPLIEDKVRNPKVTMASFDQPPCIS